MLISDWSSDVCSSYLSGVAIEPFLTDQWYVDAATLVKPAIEAVEQGRTAFVPKQWEKTYYEWMRNIQPWCISRQLWWGHQVPAWYGPRSEERRVGKESVSTCKSRRAPKPSTNKEMKEKHRIR